MKYNHTLTINLYNTFIENGDIVDEIILDDVVSNDIIVQFNERIIEPDNINEILTLCDFLMIENTLQFIVKYATVTNIKYVLDERHKEHYELPVYE
jgi:hypothetical protein